VQGARPFAEGPLRLSNPVPPETSKLGRVIGVVTSQTQAGVLLAVGWQGRRLFQGTRTIKTKKRVRKVMVILDSIELFAPS